MSVVGTQTLFFCIFVLILSAGGIYGDVISTSFSFSGSLATWVVPNDVTSVTATLQGASGAGSYYSHIEEAFTVRAGLGGRVVATLTVTPGMTLFIYVGGEGSTGGGGGFNGGGAGDGDGGGGGGTDIRATADDLTTRMIVAGGGGGVGSSLATCYNGGNGGYPYGAPPNDGACPTSGGFAGGGSQTSGGSGGDHGDWKGVDGTLGVGGDGENDSGGGGGGYYGGGGGGSGSGGGGGSSYCGTSSCSSHSFSTAADYGHGFITLSYNSAYSPSLVPVVASTIYPTKAKLTCFPTNSPTVSSTTLPTRFPSFIPTIAPSATPSSGPSVGPSNSPTVAPTISPSTAPSFGPTAVPSMSPSIVPTFRPTIIPSMPPTTVPSFRPTIFPSISPTTLPSFGPTITPYGSPTTVPSTRPTILPTQLPTISPTHYPTSQPSKQPSMQPRFKPSKQPSSWPSRNPSFKPSNQPTKLPSKQPYIRPSEQPSIQPSSRPSEQPSGEPTVKPSIQPSKQPSIQPSIRPSEQPSGEPTIKPSIQPSKQPCIQPCIQPSIRPSEQPSGEPTVKPSIQSSIQPSTQPSTPTTQPTNQPIRMPSIKPTMLPSRQPSTRPSQQPFAKPSKQPSFLPSKQPVLVPTSQPTEEPTSQPIKKPTGQPSNRPSIEPSSCPSQQPSIQPSSCPSNQPTYHPTTQPTFQPLILPSIEPSIQPSRQPSSQPSRYPSSIPSQQPSFSPTEQPVFVPTLQPTEVPTSQPAKKPTGQPSVRPSVQPSSFPSRQPSTQPSSSPSNQPKYHPTVQPCTQPSNQPSSLPSKPSIQPSNAPTQQPNTGPSRQPSSKPSFQPIIQPSSQPSRNPSLKPSLNPTIQPTLVPSKQPSSKPSTKPSPQPSNQPLLLPTFQPNVRPTFQPISNPSVQPSTRPSANPSSQPLQFPSHVPSIQPSTKPSKQPLSHPSSQPSEQPSSRPTNQPIMRPSNKPSDQPSSIPSAEPSQPSQQPTYSPSKIPSIQPSQTPSREPSAHPSIQSLSRPSNKPSSLPSGNPTSQPSKKPSRQPLGRPTFIPSNQPVLKPSLQPANQPTDQPIRDPSIQPSKRPSHQPSHKPVNQPTTQPLKSPTFQPFLSPTTHPTMQPTSSPTRQPSSQPSTSPTRQPSSQPIKNPSKQPTRQPLKKPSKQPIIKPSKQPSKQPISIPTIFPSSRPTAQPSALPHAYPSRQPTSQPISQPTKLPSPQPSRQPSSRPMRNPSFQPSNQPEQQSTRKPSNQPTRQPSRQPVSRPFCPSHLLMTHIPVTIIPPESEIISSIDDLSYFNVNNQLTLTGTIFSYRQCTTNWTIRNSSISIAQNSVVSGVKLVSPMQWNIATVVLKPSTLVGREIFQFDLRCGYLHNTVVVITNQAPKGGRIHVSPSIGYEVQTAFVFKAMNWTDKDLPMSYQFSYYSPQSYQLAIGARSQHRSSVTSLLPAGSSVMHYSINCSVQVFDLYDASAVATSSLFVQPVSSAAVQQFVVSTINASSNGLSLSTINLLGSLLNKVNCSGSPNCATLNRSPCSTVDHICGSCLNDYIGESGFYNSRCISFTPLHLRNSSLGSMQKHCMRNCSGHGRCMYEDINTGEKLQSCDLLSTACEAVCVCSDGYAGSSCGLTETELEQKQEIRAALLTSLLNLTQHTASASATLALASSLFVSTTNQDEIPSRSSSSILSIVDMLLDSAQQFNVDQQDFSQQILSAINAVTSIQQSSQQAPTQLVQTLENFILFSSTQLYPSQDSVDNVFPNFKTSVSGLSSSSIVVPLTTLELFARVASSSVDVSALLHSDISLIQATRLGIVELKQSAFKKNSSFVSNPIVITHSMVGSQNMTVPKSQPRYILVTLVHNTGSKMEVHVANFSSVCHRRNHLSTSLVHRYVCPSSGYVIVHNCTNKVGVLTTTCPPYQPSCSSLTHSKHPFCELVSFSRNTTLCNCSLSHGMASTRRRLDSSSSNVVESTSLQIVATGQYMVEQVGETLSASPSLASPETLQHVYIVASTITALWFIGFALLAVGRWIKMRKVESKSTPVSTVAVHSRNMREDISAYIAEVVPVVFRGEVNSWKTFVDVFKHHKYFVLGSVENINMLYVSRVVTVQCMLMFVLAITYDLQSPSDDGTCLQWNTEEACTLRKSYLDSSQTYCEWIVFATDDMGTSFSGYACSYQEPATTLQEVLTISVLVSIVTALFLRPMEYLFNILNAPIANRVKIQPLSRIDMKQHVGRNSESSTFAELLKNHHVSKIAGVQVRNISESTIAARTVARKTLYHFTKVSSTSNGGEHKVIDDAMDHDTSRSCGRVWRNRRDDSEFQLMDATFSKSSLEVYLVMTITRKRQHLSGATLDLFDAQWGILRYTDSILAASQSRDLSTVLFISGMFDKIYRDVERVRSRSIAKIESLRVTTEEQVGLEIFQLFIIDLLGRNSPAAKIFGSKLGEDFEETKVVKYNKKVIAAAVLVTLNVLFCNYSILYGSVRGEAWQMIYLQACLVQFFIEIFINETLECVWLHYIVPMLAAREVRIAHGLLVDLVERFCRADTQTLSEESSVEFNAPDYLFVSTNVAKAFPSLMESSIVQSYITPLPGESAKQWHQSRWQRFLNHIQTPHNRENLFFRMSVSVLLTVFTLLEYGATTPFLLQKMFVRFCQPFLASGIVLAFYKVIESPLYIALFFLSATAAVLFANRQSLLKKFFSPRLSVVTPLPNSATAPVEEVEGNNSREYGDDEELSISYSLSSESLVSMQESSIPSPLNTSEEGSFYSSMPDSSDDDEIVYIHVSDSESDISIEFDSDHDEDA